MRKYFLSLILLGLFTINAANAEYWYNHLRDDFINNRSVILEINLRTFNAKDKNGNGIIDKELGEESGNFVNAIQRLDELKNSHVTAIHLMPITPVGQVKALGTAGSLYAIKSFSQLNPQLDAPNNKLSVYDEAKQFIKECHNRGIAVIVDLPSCGSYDLFLSNPDLFVIDKKGEPVVPVDWTDTRLFKVYNDKGELNDELLSQYMKFVDLMQGLGVDGIRADVATSKPAEFWEQIIRHARSNDPQFLFLAEASEKWTDAISPHSTFTSYDKLLDVGFDGFYGSFFDYKNMTADDFIKYLKSNQKFLDAQSNAKKAVIGSFATHDEISPLLVSDMNYARQLFWLNATLPLNSYLVDGIQSGDDYLYAYANRKADKTYTDDNFYYVHKGKFDIFNYSRRPGGKNFALMSDYVESNRFKLFLDENMPKKDFFVVSTGSSKAFAYARTDDKHTILVIVNKDLKNSLDIKVKARNITKNTFVYPIVSVNVPLLNKGNLTTKLNPGEIQVYLFEEVIF